MNGLILEPFGGPGGWSTGLALLDRRDAVGIDLDADACRTAVAAGHRRVRADVAAFPLGHLAGRVEGVVMSPPCQAFSRAGKRLGLADQPALFAHLRLVQQAGRWVPHDPADWHDPRSPLVLEVVRWVDALRPAWLVCEQVPDVLPFWQAVARWLRRLGYASAVGLRSSEQFGVPQTRLRAFLAAARDGRPVRLPSATHRAYRSAAPEGPDLFGDGLLPWVSMADALGWGDGVSVDCASPFQVVPGFDAAVRPCRTLTHKSRSWAIQTNQVPSGAGDYQRRDDSDPSPTVSGQGCSWAWTLETEQRADTAAGRVPITREHAEPAPTLVANADRWEIHGSPQDNATVRGGDELAPTVHFGAGMNQVDWVAQRQYDAETVRVEVWQAGVLQSFPADYPWQGTRTARFRQVGDAVPPLLAAAVAGEVLGVDWQRLLWGLERAS